MLPWDAGFYAMSKHSKLLFNDKLILLNESNLSIVSNIRYTRRLSVYDRPDDNASRSRQLL